MSLRNPQSAIRNLDALGGFLLALALATAIVGAWRNPSAEGYYAMRRAETLLSQGRYSAAQILLEQTLIVYNSPQVRLDLSYAYLARRDAERAERQARLARQIAPPHLQPAILTQLGRVLLFAGRDTEALAAWDEARKAAAPYDDQPDIAVQSRSALWHTAMLYWARGDWDAARRDLETLASGSDVYAQSAQLKLIQLLAPVGREISVTDDGRRTTDDRLLSAVHDLRVPGLGEGLSAATIDALITNIRLAKAEADKAKQSGATHEAIDTIWGGSYLQQGETRLAREYLQRALSLNPSYEPAHARLALALLDMGESAVAFEHLKTAVRLDPNDPLPHHLLARLYMGHSEWSNAEEQLRLLQKLEPLGVELHLQWAEYYRLLGEYEKAEDAYIDAANLQVSGAAAPSGTNAPLTLSRFYTDVRGFGCEKGLPAARQSLALHPDDPASFDAVGWALVQCKQPADALSALEGAVKAAPDVPRYRLHLAKAYSALGRYADAREQYAWTLDLDPGGPLERLALNDLVALPR